MPTLILEDLPGEIYERIERQAKARNQTISEEVIRLLHQSLSSPAPEAIVPVAPPRIADSPRLPFPPILDTGEISPPCTLPRPGVGVQVPTVPGGARRPTSIIVEEEDGSDHV